MLRAALRRLSRPLLAPLLARWREEARLTCLRELQRSMEDREHLCRLLATQYLKKLSRPLLSDGPTGTRILVLAPHQDDAALGAGGTLHLCRQRGSAVRILYVTDGAARMAGAEREAVAATRREEAEAVWSHLDIADLVFWDLPNRGDYVTQTSVDRLVAAVGEYAPDSVFIPSWFEPPVEHRKVSCLFGLAASRLAGLQPVVWQYGVTGIPICNAAVDITSVAEAKYAANRQWNSQNRVFNWGHMARGRDAYTSHLLIGCEQARGESYFEPFLVTEHETYLTLFKESGMEEFQTQPADASSVAGGIR